jgi:hypothetical protein
MRSRMCINGHAFLSWMPQRTRVPVGRAFRVASAGRTVPRQSMGDIGASLPVRPRRVIRGWRAGREGDPKGRPDTPGEVTSQAARAVRQQPQYCGQVRICAVRWRRPWSCSDCQNSCAPMFRPIGRGVRRSQQRADGWRQRRRGWHRGRCVRSPTPGRRGRPCCRGVRHMPSGW